MLIPGVAAVILFHYAPLFGVVIAFEDFNANDLFASPWVGLGVFKFVFALPGFVRTSASSIAGKSPYPGSAAFQDALRAPR